MTDERIKELEGMRLKEGRMDSLRIYAAECAKWGWNMNSPNGYKVFCRTYGWRILWSS